MPTYSTRSFFSFTSTSIGLAMRSDLINCSSLRLYEVFLGPRLDEIAPQY